MKGNSDVATPDPDHWRYRQDRCARRRAAAGAGRRHPAGFALDAHAVRLDRPESWAAALDGVSNAYVTYQPDLAVEGASEAIAELSRLAREKGLEHIVLLSGRGEPGAQRAEAALQASGVPWTIVRASWFNQNFSEGYLLDGVMAGEIALPAGAVLEPFIDVDDIADVVVAALTESVTPASSTK